MKNEKLLEYIASLSAEERETYRDLIEESLKRDEMLQQNVDNITISIESLTASFHLLLDKSLELGEGLSDLRETLEEIRDASVTGLLMHGNGPVWN